MPAIIQYVLLLPFEYERIFVKKIMYHLEKCI